MEHLLQKSKCSNFQNIFKNMNFQRRQKALLWGKGLKLPPHRVSVLVGSASSKGLDKDSLARALAPDRNKVW